MGDEPGRKPMMNVLMISIDDLNDWTGFMRSHPQARTPNMDALAASGTVFSNAHCQAPICGPSRASLFTGLYPHTTGIYGQYNKKQYEEYMASREDMVQLPEWFKRHGYQTWAVGKVTHGPATRIFDYDHGRFDGFGPKPDKRFAYNPAWFPEKQGGTQTDWGAYPDQDEKLPDYKISQWAVSQLEKSHGEPFFLAVGFIRPHVPWYVPQEWLDYFPLHEVQLPPWKPDDLEDVPPAGIAVNETPQMPTARWAQDTDQWRRAVRAYLASVYFVDHQIGKVMKALKESEYADNTVIILFSDHGYHMGEKDRFSKHTLWERSTRVPMVISAPGIAGNKICHKPVELVDIYPTLTDLCGLTPNTTNQGQSLKPLLVNPEIDWHFPALTAYGRGNYSVRDEHFRLTRYFDGSLELYDHRHDTNEWHNLADSSQYNEVLVNLLPHIPSSDAPWAPPSDHNANDHFLNYQRNHRQ